MVTIEAEFAKRFIERFSEYTAYNINVMDQRGMIIASRDPSRVGTYHDAAYQIIHSSSNVLETYSDSDLPGVKAGVNSVVQIGSNRIGVVGVTGHPDQVRPIALIIRIALEEMVKYELKAEEQRIKRSQKEKFIQMLTTEGQADISELRSIAAQLNYSEAYHRIALLCRFENGDIEEILGILKSSPLHTKEDISFVLNDPGDRDMPAHLLIFKTLPENETVLSDYKYLIGEYLSQSLRHLREHDIRFLIYVGSIQQGFGRYCHAYEHCRWLERNINTISHAAFFYDHIGEYMDSLLPMRELQHALGEYDSILDDRFKKSFMETMDATLNTNWNLKAAADRLYIHKNTMMYRYQKIKDRLNVDPLNSRSDRRFVEALYYYLKGLGRY